MRRIAIGQGFAVVIVGVIWWLRGRADDHSQAQARAKSATQAAHVAKAHVPAKPATISGKVTRKADGAGVGGAIVSLAWAELGVEFGSSKIATVIITTEPTGAWTAKDIPPSPPRA